MIVMGTLYTIFLIFLFIIKNSISNGDAYIKHKSPYVKNELTKAIDELRKDTEKFKEAAENGWLNHQVKHTNLIADSAASQVKELIALMGGNVSIHDGVRYPVKDLIFDGHGQVHGDETDWHYNEKDQYGNGKLKNPENAVKLLTQLANGDAALILASAHDLQRSTKGHRTGDHPAEGYYEHSKDGKTGRDGKPLPIDNNYVVAMRKHLSNPIF